MKKKQIQFKVCVFDIVWKVNNRSFYSSFNECVSETVGASNVQNLRWEVWIFADVHSVLFTDIVAVIYQFFVEEVELVVICDHSYAWFRGEYLFGIDLERERSWLPFIEETVIEDSACLSSEDQWVGTSFKIDDFLVFVELIMGSAEGWELVIAHYQRICSGSEYSTIVDTSAIDSSIVEQ